MSDTGDAAELAFYPGVDAIPEDALRSWTDTEMPSFCLTPEWFKCQIAAGLNSDDRAAIGVLRTKNGRVLAILPARFADARMGPLRYQNFNSLTGPYACLYQPVLSADAEPAKTGRSLGRHLGNGLRRSHVINFDAVDHAWPGLGAFETGLRESGFRSARYRHFGNWSEPRLGRSFPEYMSARDGSLREIVRRRHKALEKQGARYVVLSDASNVEAGIADYESVYSRSWKEPEPYPKFHDLMMHAAAARGALRLGFCYLRDAPIAVQLWIVWNRCATVLKLAHDQEFDRLSPGTVLLAHMIRHVMEQDAVEEIDFGRGDDPYKRQWATVRRQRIGVIAANPSSVIGLSMLAKQFAGRALSILRHSGSGSGVRNWLPSVADPRASIRRRARSRLALATRPTLV